MFHVFEALDELVAMIEEARGLPMSAQCMVPRSDAQYGLLLRGMSSPLRIR